MSIEETRWGDALQVLHDHRNEPPSYAGEQLRMPAEIASLRRHWRESASGSR